jgi:DNA (cytosine-5)-methyltransferase 1
MLIADTLKGHHGRMRQDDTYVAHTLRADGFDASEDGTGRGTPLVPVAFNHQAGGSKAMLGTYAERVTALGATQTPAVAFIVNAAESCATASHARQFEVARCIDSTGSLASSQGGTVVKQPTGVRRLTPRECERLQGFPDDWTAVPFRGKPMADGPRYKMIGNSMAVPVVRWIGRRLMEVA